MFFVINKIELGTFSDNNLVDTNNKIKLTVFRQLTRTALFSAYSKKVYGEFWDETTQRKIARRSWTPEMKAFANQKFAEAAKPPFTFKLTIVGWIFVLLMIVTMGLIISQEIKSPAPKSAEFVAMEQAPIVGNIYFGHFESFNAPEERVASDIGFGWFKIINIEGDIYYIAKSTQMNKSHKPKEDANSTNFETDGIPSKITKQAGYMINMKAVNGKTEIYFTDKK